MNLKRIEEVWIVILYISDLCIYDKEKYREMEIEA